MRLPVFSRRPASRGDAIWRRAAIAGLVIVPVSALVALDFPLCATAGLLGVPCPGCGLTRATLAALSGRFAEAFRLHPLFWLIAPLYVYFVSSLTLRYILGSRAKPASPRADKIWTVLALVALGLLTLVWIARFFGAFGGPAPVRTWSSFTR